MRFKFENVQISGLLVVIPQNEKTFIEEMENFDFPISRSLKLMEVMGYGSHRIVDEETTSSDLAVAGIEHLLKSGLLEKDEIDALVVVSQSPDYLIPGLSHLVHGRIGLSNETVCLDLVQGCAGYIIGLQQSFMLAQNPEIKKVVLVNVDILSRKISKRDRNSYPLVGDAASITIIEKNNSSSDVYSIVKNDGSRWEALQIPAGGFKLPSSPETSKMFDSGDGNYRSLDNLKMDGSAVFNFVQTQVPPLISETIDYAEIQESEISAYAFHQPNKFMLEKLADKMSVSYSRMPNSIVGKYGNSSGVTIPTALVSELKQDLTTQTKTYCLAGFGVGLTWASMILRIGPLNYCDIIEY